MRAPQLSFDQAQLVWNSMQDDGEYDASEMNFDYIGLDETEEVFSEVELEALHDAALNIISKYSDKNKKSVGGQIDAELISPIYLTFSGKMTPFQLSHIGFWRWLSNVAYGGFFWKFIKWRIEGSEQINWGITTPGSIIEVYFYRAWLRGHKMYQADLPDPLRYAKIGASDVWRSHIFRQDFGRDREFVKAFLDTVYDDKGHVRIGTKELRTKLIPALRAWTSGSTFSHLSYRENLSLIERLRSEGI